MQIELNPASGMAEPMLGPGCYDRLGAVAEVQGLLDRAAAANPEAFGPVAERWRKGAKDDTVYAGVFIWCVYEHPDGEDPTHAAMAWLDDLSLRGTGSPASWSADAPAWLADKEAPGGEPGQRAAAFTRLAVGEPYPKPVAWHDGAADLRLTPQGAEFILALAGPEPHEVNAFRKGNAEFALVPGDRHLMFVYRFVNHRSGNPLMQGPGLPWSDAPWEFHRQAAAGPVGVPGERGGSFLLHLILVDAATGIVQGLRMVTPPADYADALRGAVERQKGFPLDSAAASREIGEVYARHPTSTDLLLGAVARFEALRD